MTADTAQAHTAFPDGILVSPRPRAAAPAFPARFRVVRTDTVQLPHWMNRPVLDHPEAAVRYWNDCIVPSVEFDPEVENAAVVLLDTRRRALGHDIISKGSISDCIVTPAAVFRTAIVANAKHVLLIHNHPSGDPSPSGADISKSRQLIAAGKLLNVELTDSLIVGSSERDGRCISVPHNRGFTSLFELGYFHGMQ